jgi:hypothetical protein
LGGAFAQSLEHGAPDRPALFCCRLLLHEPLGDREVRTYSKSFDGAFLFW